ncbi:MAG: hypothetical protein IID45_02920, partial [Planctomycetes bacterium]|nr:hypothetical protein [Planctomycetota bacterium]
DIIKGIPSNFDVENFIKPQPRLTLPESVNRARIAAGRRVLKQMVADRIAFFKFSGVRMPDRLLQQARERGIDIEQTFLGKSGDDVFQKSIDLINRTVEEIDEPATDELTVKNISRMNIKQLGQIDVKKLSDEQAAAVDKRLKELGF